MTNYVVAHIESHNLPPKLGIFAQYHPADKIWKQVTADVTYVYCKNGNTYHGKSDISKFDKFCKDNLVNTLIHTTSEQVFPYNALCSHIPANHQYILTQILISCKIANNFREHLNGGPIEEYLHRVAPSLGCQLPHKTLVPELIRLALLPTSRAEQLHFKYRHLPDPINWIQSGYETDEVNEYTEYMSRFDFSRYKGANLQTTFELIKSINY